MLYNCREGVDEYSVVDVASYQCLMGWSFLAFC